MRKFFLLVMAVVVSAKSDPLSDEFLESLQKEPKPWKAGRNFPKDTSRKFLDSLACATLSKQTLPLKNISSIPKETKIPDTFDIREEYPQCETVTEIQDQGSCGSCWAVSAVSVMNDRSCIEAAIIRRYSVEDVLSCCLDCGDGCGGGDPGKAFQYWLDVGIVTGGRYNSSDGCKPYSIPECKHYTQGPRPPCGDPYPTPICNRTCRSDYRFDYERDKFTAWTAYSITSDENIIKFEIMSHGPVTASFTVYEDFLSYKSGVYSHTQGEEMGGHAIRVMGWGEEEGTPYWILANSWNNDWGDRGYVKFLRGSNECGIESHIVTGNPL